MQTTATLWRTRTGQVLHCASRLGGTSTSTTQLRCQMLRKHWQGHEASNWSPFVPGVSCVTIRITPQGFRTQDLACHGRTRWSSGGWQTAAQRPRRSQGPSSTAARTAWLQSCHLYVLTSTAMTKIIQLSRSGKTNTGSPPDCSLKTSIDSTDDTQLPALTRGLLVIVNSLSMVPCSICIYFNSGPGKANDLPLTFLPRARPTQQTPTVVESTTAHCQFVLSTQTLVGWRPCSCICLGRPTMTTRLLHEWKVLSRSRLQSGSDALHLRHLATLRSCDVGCAPWGV